MDAAEQVPLQTGKRVSWSRIAEEWSGGVLWTAVPPRDHGSDVPPLEVQAQLRQAFTRWGRPERLRVDNGAPWGSAGDLPTDLAWWLIGLEVAVDWDPPRRPQDKGVVERPQGTARRWAAPSSCASAAELQRRLEEMDDVQRREYPSVRGRSRLEAFPKLAPSGRASSWACEREGWSLAAEGGMISGEGGHARGAWVCALGACLSKRYQEALACSKMSTHSR